jgi:hypothetical protein
VAKFAVYTLAFGALAATTAWLLAAESARWNQDEEVVALGPTSWRRWNEVAAFGCGA